MKSGILSFNKGLFLQHMRSVLWIGLFFLLSQVVLLPLGIFVILRDDWSVKPFLEANTGNVLLAISFSVQYITYMVFPVLAGIVLTSYMTKKSSSDFMHSLPFKRETLLTHVYAAGAAALGLPILINALILLAIRPMVKPIHYTVGNIAEWAGVSLFVVLFMFITTVLIGLFIGPAILQGIMAYGIFVLPAALVFMTLTNARYFINGLAVDAYASKIMEDGIFLIRAASYETRPFTGTEWAVYLVIGAFMIAVSYYVYKVRPAEAVDETIVFPFFRWAFIFVLTFAAMLIGGMYFAELLGATSGWMIAGYVIGAAAGYTLLQMVVQKSLRLTWPWKGFVSYALLVLILLLPGAMFARSYEKAIPNVNDIEKVYIGDQTEPLSGLFYEEEQNKLKKADAGFMAGRDSVKQVRQVHQKLIGMRSDRNGYTVNITYKMKDGSRVLRQYSVSTTEADKATKELRKNVEFIKASAPIFALAPKAAVNYLTVYNNAAESQLANVADKKAVEAIRAAIERDVLSGEADMFSANSHSTVGSIDFWAGKNNGVSLYSNVHLDDEHTIAAIRKYVPNGEAFASASSVDKAFIVNAASDGEKEKLNQFIWNNEGQEPDWSNMPLKYKQVTSKEEIQQLMNPASLNRNGDQLLVIKWKGGINHAIISAAGLK